MKTSHSKYGLHFFHWSHSHGKHVDASGYYFQMVEKIFYAFPMVLNQHIITSFSFIFQVIPFPGPLFLLIFLLIVQV